MLQDGSMQSTASQDGDHSEQAGLEEEPQGLQLPPPAAGEVEVAEVRDCTTDLGRITRSTECPDLRGCHLHEKLDCY